MTTWSKCSDDGLLCYICNDDTGPCICNWFYKGEWQATTDCGSGFNSVMGLYEAGSFSPNERVELEGNRVPISLQNLALSLQNLGISQNPVRRINPQPLPSATIADRPEGVVVDMALSPIVFTWPVMRVGECSCSNAVLTISPQGMVTFSAQARSESGTGVFGPFHSDSFLIWFVVIDLNGQPIINLPQLGSPSLVLGREVSWNQTLGPFPILQNRFNEIKTVEGRMHC